MKYEDFELVFCQSKNFQLMRTGPDRLEIWFRSAPGQYDENADYVASFCMMPPEQRKLVLDAIQAGYDFARRQQAPVASERVDGAAEGQR